MADWDRENRTESRSLSIEQLGLVSTFFIVIIFAAFYSLTKTVSDLVVDVDALQRQLKAQAEELKLCKIPKRTQTTHVAFSARLKSSYTDLGPWDTIVFSDVETNEGSAYSGLTGEFSAPTSGLYVFFSHVLSREGKSIETALSINGDTKMWFFSGGSRDFHGSGSNLLVVHLQKGDKVKMVKYGPWGTSPFYVHNVFSTFSGFLLTVDGVD